MLDDGIQIGPRNDARSRGLQGDQDQQTDGGRGGSAADGVHPPIPSMLPEICGARESLIEGRGTDQLDDH